MRTIVPFDCDGSTLIGTLDTAPGRTGVLIVSGGNEPRMGAHRGMAMLAAGLAARGIPAFRFDRRGVGDSAGENCGYAESSADIFSAAMMFRSLVPSMARIVGFGNCDAAAALALFGRDAGLDAVVLANPWLGEETDDLPPAAAIRARYVERLRDPRAWMSLMRGRLDVGKAINGLRKMTGASSQVPDVSSHILSSIGAWHEDADILLAEGDATALAFAAAARGKSFHIDRVATASHSFAGHAVALETAILRSVAKH